MTTDRCTGHCCQNFYLPFSPEDIDRAYRRWSTQGQTGATHHVTMNGVEYGPIYVDIHLIAPMVVHLGKRAATMKKVNPTDEGLLGKPELEGHFYRCKHFDAVEKVCTIYELRPQMCRDYPGRDGATCNFGGCTWKARRAPKQTKKQQNERLKILQEPQVDKAKAPEIVSGG